MGITSVTTDIYRRKFFMKKLITGILFSLSFIFFVGCGVSEEQIQKAEERIGTLKTKGVPDSALSRATVYLYRAKDSQKRGNSGVASSAMDSLEILLATAEQRFSQDASRLKPWVTKTHAQVTQEGSSLTGLNKAHFDSLMNIVDSFVNQNWLIQAEENLKVVQKALPKMKMDETLGREIEKKIIGTWVFSDRAKHNEDKTVNAVEKKIFQFGRDGKVKYIESKKGKSNPTFKEDWEFNSWGNYECKGDTIHLLIKRFQAKKQDFWELREPDGKRKKWVKKQEPTYDSLITDNSQNRFIVFNDLKEDFKKRR